MNKDVGLDARRFARRLARRKETSADDDYTHGATDDEEDELMAEHAERETRRFAQVAD